MSFSNRTPAGSSTGDAERLLRFNRQVLDQALSLVAAHETSGAPAFADHTGPHLRHVIEHYEALLLRDVDTDTDTDAIVDYDRRPRDRDLERHTTLARSRLGALQQALVGWTDASLATPIRVHGQGGPAGEFDFAITSSVGRELVFLASHATHHYALLQPYCQLHGMVTDPNLGRAPATVAHALSVRSPPSPLTRIKEFVCSAFQPAN